MSDRASPEVLRALKDALREQIPTTDPPETALALSLARLQRDGIPEHEAWRWLSAALLQEMSVTVRDNRPFDRDGYVAALKRLPALLDRVTRVDARRAWRITIVGAAERSVDAASPQW